ncbi:MAG: ABC transporter ATP-binding protein [Burkholderiaceae bacterium]|jgi:branched-chain amino acid transport system ATP-binding protein|nr:ABC transporter ATP-binding protein [Burkholderiaceae bacterium]
MSEPILQVRGLSRRFAGLMAVKDVSFALERGEVLGLIGPNGAGKTTLLSMISGTLAPSAGSIVFEGRDIAPLPAFRRAHLGIGRTFQIMRPFPGLTVLDNVAIGALFGRTNKKALAAAREAARECLRCVGLHGRIDHRADELGGPDRKRLELAKALAMSPRMLLLDEVMAGLNHVEIDEVIDVIHSLRAEGLSILVIEHVMKAVRSLSDRVMVLHHGERIAEGPSDAVLNDPAVIEAYLGKRKA